VIRLNRGKSEAPGPVNKALPPGLPLHQAQNRGKNAGPRYGGPATGLRHAQVPLQEVQLVPQKC